MRSSGGAMTTLPGSCLLSRLVRYSTRLELEQVHAKINNKSDADGASEINMLSDPSPNRQVERVTEIAKLVTEMLKNDWTLAVYLRPITSQYFNIIQT